MPVAALGAVAQAALAGKFAESHGDFALHVTAREALVVYCSARGEGIPDLPWTVDASNEQAWERRWAARLGAAGVADELDAVDLIGWLRANNAPVGGGSAAVTGAARIALRSLESSGVVVNAAALASLERDMAASEAGNAEEQCTSCKCAWLLLTGESASREDQEWHMAQHASLGGMDGGTINITGRKSYRDLHKASSSSYQVLTLERALREEPLFERWLGKMVEKLQNAFLPKAGLRLMQVVAQASTQSNGHWPVKRRYLEGYFFDEYLGLGLPHLMANASAFNAMGALHHARASGVNLSCAKQVASSVVDLASVSSGSQAGNVVPTIAAPESVIFPSSASSSLADPTGIVTAMRDMIGGLSQRLEALEKQGVDGGAASIGRKCLHCGRAECPFIRGGEPCREARQAEAARNTANAARRKAAEAAAAAAKET